MRQITGSVRLRTKTYLTYFGLLETAGQAGNKRVLGSTYPRYEYWGKLTHFAPLLPSSIIPGNLICVISSHLLNKWHHIPTGKNSIFFSPHPVKSFCFQFVSSVLNFVARFRLALSWIPLSGVSRMLSGLAGASLMVVLLQPPKTIYFLAPTIASSPLPHYKQKHLQCAVENPTELAEEWPEWPNVSSVLLPAEFRCW